jgi:hypothetical protein
VVWLEGFSGCFAAKYLQKVDLSTNNNIEIDQEYFKKRHEEIYKQVRLTEEIEFNNLLNLMKETEND